MKDKNKFSITNRFRSFGYAFEGLILFFKTQHNAWIHAAAAICAIALGFYLKIDKAEWCCIIFAISLVFVTEMLNTAIEFLCDHVSPDIHPQIKKVKDISAAAVMVAAITAVITGLVIFLPKLIS